MIKVYNECKDKEEAIPQPQLRLIVDEKRIRINCVNEDGEILAGIWSVYSDSDCSTVFHIDAKEAIENEKYSTDWAEWDKNGAFIKLK